MLDRQRLQARGKDKLAVAAICALLALMLPLSLLHIAEYSTRAPQDASVKIPAPIISLGVSVADFSCQTPRDVCAVSIVRGVFARPFVPQAVGFLGGLIFPQLLLLAALVILIQRRWAVAAGLAAAAVLLAYNLIGYRSEIVETHRGTDAFFGFLSNVPVDRPLLQTQRDRGCDRGSMPSCNAPHTETIAGYFLSGLLPHVLGLLLGCIAPVILMLTAALVLLRGKIPARQ